MGSKIHGYSARLGLIFLLLLPCLTALAQVDMKHSLPELNAGYVRSKQDTAKAKFALLISNFYINNRGHSPASVDSCLYYAHMAESLSSRSGYKKGFDDARVVSANCLIIQKKFNRLQNLIDLSKGSLYCRLHILLGRYYLEKPGEEKQDLDKADSCFTIVQQQTVKHPMPNLYLQYSFYKYNLMLERGSDSIICDNEFDKIITLCHAYKNKNVEARIWFLRSTNSATPERSIINYRKTSLIALAAGDTALSLRCFKESADLNLWMGKLDSAEAQLKGVLKMYTAARFKNTQYIYDLLAVVMSAKGSYETALRYGLQAVSLSEANGTETGLSFMQARLAKICRDLGQKQQSIYWYQTCLETAIRVDNAFRYSIFRELATELITEGKAGQVLQQLAVAEQKYPPDYTGAFFIPMLRGDCYAALHKPGIAERFYLQVIDSFEKRKLRDAYYYWGYRNVASFFIQQKEYLKAKPYLDTMFTANMGLVPVADQANIYRLQFQADSAKGDYLSAIKYFEQAKAITDSIYDAAKQKQTEQLQLQFETAQRDHENLVLRNKNNVQHSELEKEWLNRKLTTIALLGSVMVLGLMIYLYRAKQKSNILLKLRQDEINAQNQQLSQLLNEKEWLVKEVHHRVKNNLQIVSSLLNTQSSYLDNEQALTAIRDSQNRMQAISIVHQKLYQSDDLSTVNLQVYIEELARSIQDSFQAKSSVKFQFELEAVRLTTADTVPLGLILNEAITNSVKYAFAEGQQGNITISMAEAADGQYQLTVKDDGKGLPAGFDAATCNSFGVNLMIGLTEQLNGKFSMASAGGTIITLIFCPALPELSPQPEA